MANDTPRDRLAKAKEKLREQSDEGLIDDHDCDAILEFAAAIDPESIAVSSDGVDTRKPRTIATYIRTAANVARRLDAPLLSQSADDINRLMDDLYNGRHEDVSDDGLAQNTISSYQTGIRSFAEYVGFCNHERINIIGRQSTNIDERDVFDREDIEAMREAITNPRDRCLFELAINTGQRATALRTLRVRDVDVQAGVFWLNRSADGLKGADENASKLPLLGAKKAVRDWLQYHPTGEDDDYLITGRAVGGPGQPGEMLGHSRIYSILGEIGDQAGVDKPTNPHNFRHAFVTIAKRDYDLDDTHIKYLLGHKQDSAIMETTYAHLSADDHIDAVEVAAGLKDPEVTESPLTPSVCPTCGETLDGTEAACAACGNVFSPVAESAKTDLEDAIYESAKQSTDEDEHEALDALKTYLHENPDVLAELLNETSE